MLIYKNLFCGNCIELLLAASDWPFAANQDRNSLVII